jgi:acetolactate synthase I/II/III large subunit
MTAGNMAQMTTAEVMVRTLAMQGVETLFCLPGVQNDDFFDALATAGKAIRPIHTRHEQATGYMALGAALATGKPQAYCVVPGPGFLNTTAALATAYATNAPVLAISGQIPDRMIGRGIGLLHEIPDQLAIMRGLTKWAERVMGPDDAAVKAREAFRQMLTNGPGPVGLECPMNVWRKVGPVAFDDARILRSTPPIDCDAVDRAAQLLGRAKKPLIVVGGGAHDASSEVRIIAEMLQAPVIANRSGHGVLDRRHPLSHAIPAGYLLWKETDVVLGVGTRLQAPMDWGVDENLKIAHLDINPNRIGVIHTPDVAIVADAAEGLRALAERIARYNLKRASRNDEMAELEAKVAALLATLGPQKAWIDAIRAELPEDGVFVEELTQVGYVSRLMFPAYQPRTFLSAGYQGTLGWGLATALGVKVSRPASKVVSISGDGGFLFGMQELATAVHHRIGVVAIVFTDGAYGNVKRIQQENYGGRVIASNLTNPDFVQLAESFGLRATRARDAGALRQQLRAAFVRDEPALVEVPVGEFPNPWGLIAGKPKVRGARP